MVDLQRVRKLNSYDVISGDIVYWMSRDQRVSDNWALIYASELAKKNQSRLLVIFCLTNKFLGATRRQYGFMLAGLKQVSQKLNKKNICFDILFGNPESEIPKYLNCCGALVTDFDPLKIKQKWKLAVAKKIKIAFYEVDAHNIVPCWIASPKQEFGAYTLRPKINRVLDRFLTEFPDISKQKGKTSNIFDFQKLIKQLKIDNSVSEVKWIKPGEKAAKKALNHFIHHKLDRYQTQRNDPNKNAQSELSPYLHFGQISAQRVALEVLKSKKASESFIEELIVRRELSDNFCFYNKNYDSFEGFPFWAKNTLETHIKDFRQYIYSSAQFEQAKTHDELWNFAQLQMVQTGKMHGYMRMYWAKKILEWTKSPQEAMQIAIYLNDKYELDGRDPNGYCGIAWSIGGVHDRAWGEREIFGKIRYMSSKGCKTKFDVKKYCATHLKI